MQDQVTTSSTGTTRMQIVAVPPPLRPPPVSASTGARSPGTVATSADAAVSSTGPAYQEVFYITGELPGGFRLQRAFPVITRIEAGEYVAEQPQLNLHAFGDTSLDAILSLRDEIVNQYTLLEEMGDRLSVRLARQRELLRRFVSAPDA